MAPCVLFGLLFAQVWQKIGATDMMLCQAAGNEGRYDEAIPHCRAAVKTDPNAINYNQLGWFLALDGQPKEALKACKRAVALEPIPTYYDSLAMALAIDGQGAKALETEQLYVLDDSREPTPGQQVTLGMIYFSVGRKDDAHREWEGARATRNRTAARLALEFEAKYY